MPLSVPAAPTAKDHRALAEEEDLVCDASDSPLAAIEKCLDNGVGACLVVDGRHYLGRVSLDELGRAALTGALLAPTLGQHLRELGRHRSNASPTDILQPDLDPAGNLIGVTVDRSAQRLQIARPDMSHCEFRAMFDAFLSSWISSKGPYVEKFEEGGGKGKPKYGQITVCYAKSKDNAKRTAFEVWPNALVEGSASQELPLPSDFEQLVRGREADELEGTLTLGPDADEYVDKVKEYDKAGYTHVYFHHVGPDQDAFLAFAQNELLPRL